MTERDAYEMVGFEGITRMTAAFYRRVREDDLIGVMYPEDDWEGSEERLRDFLLFRLGGDERYLQKRGHPRLRMRHMPFSIGVAERDRWVRLMEEAMVEAQIPEAARAVFGKLFAQVADFMRNREESGS